MALFPTQSIPTALYRRGLELGVLPRRIDLAAYRLPSYFDIKGLPLYRNSVALLAAADLTPEQRDAIERGALASARNQSSHPLYGAKAYAALVPYLSSQRQVEARKAAQPVLEQLERLTVARSWEAPYGTLLRYRDWWRVLARERYDEWLGRQLETLLKLSALRDTPDEYRERLAHLHLLTGDEARRGLELALRGVFAVGDREVTEDREWAFAGGRIYSDADVDAASRAAQIEVLETIAPILPPEFHDRVRTLAEERAHTLQAVPGSRLADPLTMHGAIWYHALPTAAIPWLSPLERQPYFAQLHDAVRAPLLDAFAEHYVRLDEEFLSDVSRRAVTGDPVAARFRILVDEDTPVAAPFLTAEQLHRIFTLYEGFGATD